MRAVITPFIAVAMASAAAACSSSGANADGGQKPSNDGTLAPLTEMFAVSDYYSPSEFDGDAAYQGYLTIDVNEGCKPRPPSAQGNCYVFTYYPRRGDVEPSAGVGWIVPANNPGHQGIPVDTSRFKQVRFFAAVEGPAPSQQGGVPTLFDAKVGGFMGASASDALRGSLVLSVGSTIDSTLRQFRIPLTDVADDCEPTTACDGGVASAVIRAFGWQTGYPLDGDPSGQTPLKIYLDDIVWDTATLPTPDGE
jgi:hypothetical protein